MRATATASPAPKSTPTRPICKGGQLKEEIIHEYYEQGAKDLSGAKLATLLKLCLALNCTLADILPDGETTELLTRYGQ